MVERGPGGEAAPPILSILSIHVNIPRCLSPTPRRYAPTDGDWQLQAPPGAPGTARQGRTRTIVSTNDGGIATQPRAPGHDRPFTASSGAAKHGRLSAATRAPGADVPLTTTARAPGQHCLSAAPRAPGHERPLAAQCAAGHDRLSAALPAPGADVPLATMTRAPGQHRPSAASIATVPVPAGLRRLRQECLPRVPANPRTPTYCPAHRDTAHNRAAYTHTSANPQSRSTVSSLRLAPQSGPRPPAGRRLAPSPGACSGGGLGRGPLTAHHTTHQAHPAIQVPPDPRSCSTAATGFLRQHPSRAPPTSTHRKPILANRFPPLHHVERGRG